MAKQQYYRASISVLEQPNGLYELHTYERFEGGEFLDAETYPNLTWKELMDVVNSAFVRFDDNRSKRFQTSTGLSWNQKSIFD